MEMKIKLEKGQKLFFTSDNHYNHKNLCRGVTNWRTIDGEIPVNQTRPFDTLEQMNDRIVVGLNSSVGEDDILINLGDFSFGGFENIEIFRNRIICKNIHLILGNHDCFDIDTEILTEDGWCKFDDWKIFKPKIASYNISEKKIDFDLPLEIYENEYNGIMYSIKNRLVDIFITPNHRLFCKRESIKKSDYNFYVVNELPEQKVPLKFISGVENKNNFFNISEDIIKLTGWILSDGSVKEGLYGVSYTIYQSEGKHQIVKNLLDKLSINYTIKERVRKTKEICGRELILEPKKSYEFYIKQGSLLEKYITAKYTLPKWLKKLSNEQFLSFLESYTLGDGSKHKANLETSWMIYGMEKQLSQIQEICFLNNIRTVLKKYRESQYVLYITLPTNTSEVGRYSDSLSKVNYNGRIFCFKTKNDTLIIRRNGKIVVIGNSHIERNKGGIRNFFKSVNDILTLHVEMYKESKKDSKIVHTFELSHYPISSWKNMNNGVIHLHGHVHLPPHKRLSAGKAMDVGVDGNNMDPISMEEVLSIMKNQPIKKLELPSDHHEERLRT